MTVSKTCQTTRIYVQAILLSLPYKPSLSFRHRRILKRINTKCRISILLLISIESILSCFSYHSQISSSGRSVLKHKNIPTRKRPNLKLKRDTFFSLCNFFPYSNQLLPDLRHRIHFINTLHGSVAIFPCFIRIVKKVLYVATQAFHVFR